MNRERLELTAPAKVNLFLKIIGRRRDGYHYLTSLMQKISLYDRIVLQKTDAGIRLQCPDSDLPENSDNLVVRAARLFFEHTGSRCDGGTGVEIILRKTIPVAAGLGGGSSDAAAVLKGLDFLFETHCTTDELITLGAALGADVPLFVVDWPCAWATGVGDRLQPAPSLTGYTLVLVNPGFSVSTAWVYESFALTAEKKIFNLENFCDDQARDDAGVDFLNRTIEPEELVNDLETVTAARFPEIFSLKEKLVAGGAESALMSGSGPTVFGLFREEETDRAAACCRELKRDYRNTCMVTPLD